MGRIKSLMIKKAAGGLFEVGVFSSDFEANKKLLKDSMPSKKVRNKIAGGIARLAKQQKAKEMQDGGDRELAVSEED